MTISNVNNSEFKFLNASSSAFRNEREGEGMVYFSSAPNTQKNQVYERLWINHGRPCGDLQYGQHAFHRKFGLNSTNQERAHAIDEFVNAQMKEHDCQQKQLVNGFDYYNYKQKQREEEFYPKIRHEKCQEKFDKKIDKYPISSPEKQTQIQAMAIGAGVFFAGALLIEGIKEAMKYR